MMSVPQFSFLFIFLILLNSRWQNCPIFDNSCTICLNITKSPHCTSTHPGLSNNTKSAQEVLWFGRSQADKTKQNKQTTFLNSSITKGVTKTKEPECNKRGWILQLIVGNLWKVRVWGLHSHSYSTVMWSISCIIWWQLFVELF